jgi:hypothetical protein
MDLVSSGTLYPENGFVPPILLHKQILVSSRIIPRKSPSPSIRRNVGHCALIYGAE